MKTLTLALLIGALAANATLNFLGDTWRCTEHVRGRIRSSTQTYRWSSDGHRLIMTEVAPPFDPYRKIVNAMEVRYTFDAAKNQWVELTTDNTGYYGLSYEHASKNKTSSQFKVP